MKWVQEKEKILALYLWHLLNNLCPLLFELSGKGYFQEGFHNEIHSYIDCLLASADRWLVLDSKEFPSSFMLWQ